VLVCAIGVVTVVGVVMVLRSSKVALDQYSVTPPAMNIVSDSAVLAKASVIEAQTAVAVLLGEVVGITGSTVGGKIPGTSED